MDKEKEYKKRRKQRGKEKIEKGGDEEEIGYEEKRRKNLERTISDKNEGRSMRRMERQRNFLER